MTEPKPTPKRLSEIDFLRGIAVILVLFHHHWFFDLPTNVGWIGVDLFFVLSGFLVSGLLFAEYKKFGDIKPLHFLIRRGFKIYPLFYFSIIVTVIIYLLFEVNGLNWKGVVIKFLPEVFFLQNYFFGYWGHHWSLAVEEHFYLFLTLLIFILVKLKRLDNAKLFVALAMFIFTFCSILKVLAYLDGLKSFTQTHLRMDSLFAGVLVSYLYAFKQESLAEFYAKYKYLIFAIAILPFFYALLVDPNNL